MPCQTSFADERAGSEHPDNPLLALLGHHDEFDMALLNVEDRVAFGALLEYEFLGFVGRYGAARANCRQERFRVEGSR